MAPKKPPNLDVQLPRVPLVKPTGLECTPVDGPLPQVNAVPDQWFSGRMDEHPSYPLPRGVMPSGAPSPTSPVNPNKPRP
jgi:hypothetical protein